MRQVLFSLIVVGFVGFSAPAEAATSINMYVTGETQGDIPGSVTRAGREDSIEVYGFSHEVVSPRDSASGLPTGKRQHKPLTVTTPIDKSAPLLLHVWATNENLTMIRIDMWRPSRTGKELQFYTIELVNASIASMTVESSTEAARADRVIISFVYEKIIETWQDGGITAEDDWTQPS